ncbi:MAG TPA: serine/threonine-protein kinase [Sandaracinaceae bacterium LLY-WYZ-13_1]|nr:serine/threonine-protein kinase [Sandaracinaceae bacterium LLY-WYZ-13_1]
MLGAGDVVGERYTILSPIATGGMGAVYRARHVYSRREVALKVLHPHASVDEATATRFRREAAAAAAIGHEGIVEVLDAGVDPHEGSLYLAMELLNGEHLGHRLVREGTTLADALSLFDRLLDPLAAAHERGFVHRDLKPENVFVLPDPDGGPERTKLLDFGIAKPLAEESATLTGSALGTPHYMSPEQIMSSKAVTPAADVWAVGVMLYEICTGQRPYDGPTPQAVLVKACTERPVAVAERAPAVGPALGALVDRCLAREPEGRPSHAEALRAALRAAVAADGPFDDVPLVLERYVAEAETSSRRAPSVDTPKARAVTAVSTAPRVGWRRVEGDGWSLEVPPDWVERTSMVPHVTTCWEAPELLEGVRPRVLLKVEAFDGDTRTYNELGMGRLDEVARIHRLADATLAGHPCLEAEAVFESAEVPFRGLRRAVVIDGRGYMMACDGPVLRFGEVAPIFRAVVGSLALAPA